MAWAWLIKGGPVMWPLLGCSVIAVAVVIERTIFWLRERRTRDPERVHRILHLTERGLLDEAAQAASARTDPAVRILDNGLSHHHFSLDGALEVAGNSEINRMRRYLGFLETIVTVAPLMGIFGTVLGIMQAFGALEGQIPDPQVVSRGIAQAVTTTVFGLGVAIPTLLGYNLFFAKAQSAAEQISAEITNFQIVYRKGKQRNPLRKPAFPAAPGPLGQSLEGIA